MQLGAAPSAALPPPRLARRHRGSQRSIQCAASPDAGGAAGTRLYVARRYGVDVVESTAAGRRLRDYVRLPADRYNVLDSRAVTRVSENEFRVSTGVQRMVMFEAEPVGYIGVRVLAEGVEQTLSRAELKSPKPNKVVDEINATLGNLQLTNTVTSEPSPDGGVQLVCQLVLDGRFTRGVLSKVPEARLNGLMSWALGAAMPWFLGKLRDDYAQWAQDLPRNASLGSGEMAALARQVAAGGAALPRGVRELPVTAALAAAAVRPATPTAEEASAGPADEPGRSHAPQPPAAPRGFGKKR